MTTGFPDEHAIYKLACECEDLFDKQLSHNIAGQLAVLFSEYRQQFAAWAGYLGVFARVSQSLDYRLRNSTDLQDLVVRLLDLLRRTLTQIVESSQKGKAGRNEQLNWEPSKLEREALGTIEYLLGRLNSLGIAIRKSSNTEGFARVKKFADGLNLGHFECLSSTSIRFLYPNAHPELKDYLSRSMVERYATMLHMKSRQFKLQTRRTALLSPIQEEPEDQAVVAGPSVADVTATVPLATPQIIPASESDLTSINDKKARLILTDLPKALSQTRRTSSVQAHGVLYPKPPKESKTCVWCSAYLSKKDLEPSNWRHHVNNDLKPYLCILEECVQGFHRYSSFTAWFEHMQEHGKNWHQDIYKLTCWICPICEEDQAAFNNAEALLDHLRKGCGSSLHIDKLQIISQQSKTNLPRPIDECPICCYKIEQMTDSEGSITSTHLNSRKRQRALFREKQNKFARITPEVDHSNKPDLAKNALHESNEEEAYHLDDAGKLSDPKFAMTIAQHIARHLDELMVLTIRLEAIQGQDETSSERIESDVVDVDSTASSSHLSDLVEESTQIDSHGDEEYYIAIPNELSQPVDWKGVPLCDETPMKKDVFFQELVMSGTFQNKEVSNSDYLISPYGLGVNLFDAPDIDNLFVGREMELQKIHDKLKPESDSPRRKLFVLGGIGGMGKTQLAIAYANKYSGSYLSVFWLNAASEAILKTSFETMAKTRIFTHLDEFNIKEAFLYVSQWLAQKENSNWLLIFDNYDNPQEYDINKYFPSASHGSIIITTRLPEDVQTSNIKLRVLPLSSVDESLKILQTRSERGSTASDSWAQKLAKRLNGIPLALATAGSYLKQSNMTFQEYLELYESRWQTSRPYSLPEYSERTLYTTWNISYQHLQNHDADAAKMLKLLAYFSPESIWYELLHGGTRNHVQPEWFSQLANEKADYNDVMSMLAKYCFIEVHAQKNTYSMHVCVHDWALQALNSPIDQSYWIAYDCVSGSINLNDWGNFGMAEYGPITRHAQWLTKKCFKTILEGDGLKERLQDLDGFAEVLYCRGQLKAAKKIHLAALSGKSKALGPDHTSTLDTVNNLGVLYKDLGQLERAQSMYQRALAGYEKALGPDHTSTLDTVYNLGVLYKDLGQLEQAQSMYQRALAGYEKALGPDHTSTLDTVYNLGVLYKDLGQLEQAQSMYQRALAGYEKALGPDHTSTLNTLHSLGVLYWNLGQLEQAQSMYQRALAGYEKALGPDHTSTLGTVNNLGVLYKDLGQLEQAQSMYQRALAGREKALGPDHTSTLGTVNNLGGLYKDLGQLEQAQSMYKRALAGREKALGPDHTSTLGTVNNLGVLYADLGQLEQAQSMYKRALAGYEKALGPEHKSTLITVNNLYDLYTQQGKTLEADHLRQNYKW